MRIGVDCWGLSGTLAHTGAGQYAQHLVSALAALAAPDLVCYGGAAEPRPGWLPAGVVWRPVRQRHPAKITPLVSRIWEVPRLALEDGLDVFHAPTMHVRASMPPIVTMRVCPTVVTIHDLIPRLYYGSRLPLRLRLFYGWNLRRTRKCARVITVSNAARDEIVAGSDIDWARIDVIYHGVDFPPEYDDAVLERLGIRPPFVLFAGSYEPRKNLARAISAFEHACGGQGYTLAAIVEASSGHAASVAGQIHRLGNRVRLLHDVADRDLRAVYSYASALLFPSLAEGFGFPPLQAAACGVPVVASHLASIREVMDDAALFVDPLDAQDIARGLSQALFDTNLRQRLIDAGRTRAAGFSWETSARRHLAVYRAAAAHG